MTASLHVQEFGDRSAPPVVFIHAIATTAPMWRPQIDAFSPKYRVLALDLPGHGRSAPFASQPVWSDYTDAVIATLDAYGVSRAAIVGLSFGSMIAQHMAVHAPDRVAALVLSNGVAFTPDPVRAMWHERIAAARAQGMAGQVEATLDRWFTPAFRADPAVAPIGRLVASTPLTGYLQAAEVIAALDNREMLPRISAPTLVLAGEADAAAPRDAVAAIADAIPDAAFASLPAGHLMNIEAAQGYSALLGDFLSSALRDG